MKYKMTVNGALLGYQTSCLIIFFVFAVLFSHPVSAVENSALQETINTELLSSAKGGDPVAQNELAVLYEKGDGVAQNYAIAMQLYMKSFEAGYPKAGANIARLFLLGLGVPKDESQGIAWMQKSADLGFPAAQSYIGSAYLIGNIYKQDYQKAFDYLSKAAGSGDPDAQHNLGNMYLYGQYVEKDFIKAGRLYEGALKNLKDPEKIITLQDYLNHKAKLCSSKKNSKGEVTYDLDACHLAVATNDPAVLHAVGLYYLSLDNNDEAGKSFDFMVRSAKQKFAPAQIHLAIMYHEGKIVPQNKVEAYAWMSTADSYPNLNIEQRETVYIGQKSLLDQLGFFEKIKARSKAREYFKIYGYKGAKI